MRVSRRAAAFVSVAVGSLMSGGPTPVANGAIITTWSFTSTAAAPDNSPAPTAGSGTLVTLGMTNTYNSGNTASADVVATPGTANTSFSKNTWRVRGAQTPTGHNGWATHAAGAAQYTQGLEVDASTVGYNNIQFSFDWYSTSTGVRDLQVQYNTNTSNSAGWTNIGGTSPTGTYIAVANDYYNASSTGTNPTITVNLSSVASANNDPNFGVRLVSAYDSTGNVPNDYASAALTNGQTVIYNNSSGNWRFDNLTVSGVPEPAGMGLMAAGGLCLLARRRRVGNI